MQHAGKMYTVAIAGSSIKDWGSFHAEFDRALGFPDFYGRNMSAWIDCVGDIYEDTGMTKLTLEPGTVLCLQINDSVRLKQDFAEGYYALIDACAQVNESRLKGVGCVALVL